jgi:hypothetical protein
MCGLVGVVCKRPNGFSREHQDIFSTLLFVDTMRGRDSTGIFVVNNEGDVYVAKDEGMAPGFMESKEYETAMTKAWNRGSAMIGHNRAATRGVVNDANAHPFNVENNIILVHNGTMRSDHKKHADVEVDSHAIAHLIHEKPSVSEALSSFYGAYALIWYDIAKGELNFIRNDERPLFWMELDDAWVWSSEKCMLEFAAARTGAKVKTPPTSLSVDTLQKFTLKGKGWSVSDEKVEVKKPPVVSYNNNTNNFMGNGNGRNYGNRRDSRYYDEEVDWSGYGVFGNQSLDDNEGPPFREETSNILTPQEFAQRRRDREWDERMGLRVGKPGDAVLVLPPPTEPLRPRQQQHSPNVQRVIDQSKALVERAEPVEFAGLEARERELARRANKIIPYGHYRDIIIGKTDGPYAYNVNVLCAPFEYERVNGKDGGDGYYLYATPFDDDDLILRHFFPAKAVTEERMIQISGCEYVYEFTLKVRSWHPMDPEVMNGGTINDKTPGFVVIKCANAKLVSSGQQSKISH